MCVPFPDTYEVERVLILGPQKTAAAKVSGPGRLQQQYQSALRLTLQGISENQSSSANASL
jgi:hypothetical protein